MVPGSNSEAVPVTQETEKGNGEWRAGETLRAKAPEAAHPTSPASDTPSQTPVSHLCLCPLCFSSGSYVLKLV